jgi:predicted DNA-binding transcriptional regulator AlpA
MSSANKKRRSRARASEPSAIEKVDPSSPPVKLLSQRAVCERIGVSAPTIWKWTRDGKFPKARRLNGGKLGYDEREVGKWILDQPLQKLKPADEKTARAK